LAPLVWNVVARTIRTSLPASTGMTARYVICYLLAVWIFGFSSFRDVLSVDERRNAHRRRGAIPSRRTSLQAAAALAAFV
jgi:hypothetical protein